MKMNLTERGEAKRPSRVQFGLGAMLVVVAAFCVLFGLLSQLGLNGADALIAFCMAAATALASVIFFEICRSMSGKNR